MYQPQYGMPPICQPQNYGFINQPATGNSFSYTPPRAMIPGRMVSALDEIVPNEVPMDGSYGVFPKNDYSAIYLKAWNSDGTIKTITFVPKIEEKEVQDPNAPVIERLTRIERLLESRNKQQLNQKKESDDGR